MKTSLQPWQLLFLVLAGWINRRQQDSIGYLRTEDRILREKLGKKRILLNDVQRRRLAVKGKILGRSMLDELAGIVTPETSSAGIASWSPGTGTTPTGVKRVGGRLLPRRSWSWSCGWQSRARLGDMAGYRGRSRTSGTASPAPRLRKSSKLTASKSTETPRSSELHRSARGATARHRSNFTLRGSVVDDPIVNTDWLPTLLELTGQPVLEGLDGISFSGFLLGRSPAPDRKFYWHFPHYDNQGGRPSGAKRDGHWMMVEYYDAGKAELYDLSKDHGESMDLATREKRRVSGMRAALDAWRRSVGAQSNSPNPRFEPQRFRELYSDIDPSRYEPARASPEDFARMRSWRKAMDAAVSAPPKKQ